MTRQMTRRPTAGGFVPSATLALPVSETRDHMTGPSSARVTMVEYGDYQCPYCGAAYPIVKKVRKKYTKNLKFVFRNFPLPEVHPRAEFGAQMAEAAAAQGKFWEMHDFLYENQASLNDEDVFLKFAKAKLSLDTGRLAREVESRSYAPRIREDFISGIRSGVNGTPTFFLNGTRHDDSFEFDVLTSAIDTLVKK